MSATCFDRLSLQKLCFRTLRKSYPKSENQEGKKSGKFGSGSLTHAWRARIPTVMLFFCCHKCHTRTKIVEKRLKNLPEKVMRSLFFLVMYCVFRGTESMKYQIMFREYPQNVVIESFTRKCVTLVTAKTIKLPVTRVYACAREG